MKSIVALFLFTLRCFSFNTASAQGVKEAWEARFDGTGNSFDRPSRLVVDKYGNVYVAG